MSNSSSSSNPRVCIVYHEGIKDYDFGPEYELKGDRFPRYIKLLETQGILKREGIDIYTPEPATDEDLMLVHSKEYIKKSRKNCRRTRLLGRGHSFETLNRKSS